MSRSLGHRAAQGLAALLLAATAPPARAQSDLSEAESSASEPPTHTSPFARFGVARLSRRLDSSVPEERWRAMQRLGELGSAAALERLASHAVEHRAKLVGREWLTLARALAAGAGEAKIQLALAMLLNQAPSPAAGPDEAALLELARGTSALGLAAAGGQAALLVLGRALRARGAPARAAADALLAHPPRELDPLLEPGPPSVELAELLGALGDQRAFDVLRGWVRGDADDAVRAAAALALTRLGHLETVALGARWLESGGELGRAGLDILLSAQDPRAEPRLRELLAAERVGADDRQRLLGAAGPGLAGAALSAVEHVAAGEEWRWALLARVGGGAAVERLGRALDEPQAAFAAARALSRLKGDGARAGLESALTRRAALPVTLRAAALRARDLGEQVRGLSESTAAALRSDLPSERAAAAWARALGGGEAALAELRSGDEARVLAAASQAYGFGAAPIAELVKLLEAAAPGRVRDAASACLATATGRERVDSALLWSLVAESGPARPLALRALAARADSGLVDALPSLLADPDPLLRAHVARGLGESAESGAVGLLIGRLEIEPDERVRHAIVIALGAQHGRAVSTWLALEARLDPSARVRSAARLALAGVPLADPPPGRESLWLALHTAAPGATLLLELAPGLALPVVADPAGIVVATGLPSPEVGIRLQ